jgi:hypothetical protein
MISVRGFLVCPRGIKGKTELKVIRIRKAVGRRSRRVRFPSRWGVFLRITWTEVMHA